MCAQHIASELEAFLQLVERKHGIPRSAIARGVYLSHETGTHATPSSSCAHNEVQALRACFGDAKALPGLGEAVWGVAADVCAALAFLHRRSVIHGDVKAANVLLGNGGVAKISDFGLARVVGTAGFTRTSSSHGGTGAVSFDLRPRIDGVEA